MHLYERGGKRLLDLTVGIVGLVLLSPVIAVVAVFVRRNLGSPVLFRQQRQGRDGAPFTLLKFRTMRNGIASDGSFLPDLDRLTPFGQRLRAMSLDELPELVNIVRGEMSLVGPRPLLIEYQPLYSPRQATRFRVRPGLTGWAQVNGRNAVDWPERLEMDAWYAENVSIWLDARIILRTIGVVFVRRGISAEGEATMPPFGGN